jgi:type II secretory pathway component GspD/PulD (secretin)
LFTLLIAILAAFSEAPAQEVPGSKSGRATYWVRHGTAADLAAALGQHLKGQAELIPDPVGNAIFISAAQPVMEEAAKLLERLDRRPQQVTVEVVIAEVARRSEGNAGEDLDETKLTGPASDVGAYVEAMKKKGVFKRLKRVELTALERQSASAIMSENKPYVTGMAVQLGKTTRLIAYREVGTVVKLALETIADKTVPLSLTVEDSMINVPDDGIQIGTDDLPLRAAEFVSTKLTTRVNVTSGHALLAKGFQTATKGEQSQNAIIVIAQIVESPASPIKAAPAK